MALSKLAATVAIAVIGAVGTYGVLYNGFITGLFPAITIGMERMEFPGCPVPFKSTYTGVAVLDETLLCLVPFFCFILNGKQTWADTLSNWYLTAQWVPAWVLLSLEAIRKGNRGRAASW